MKRASSFPGYLLIAPQFALLVLVQGGPALYLARLAFAETDFIGFKWVGLYNFREIVIDPVFRLIMANTGLYLLIIVSITMAMATVAALLAYDLRPGIRSYLRVTLYMPTLTAGLVIANVWRWIWHPSAGVANWILSLVGIAPVWWLGGRLTGIFAISCNLILGNVGFFTMVLLATILTIPHEILDAARVDGASPWQVRLRMILPGIAPTIALMTTLNLISSSQMWETVMMTTNGGPDHATATLMFDIYETGFLQGRFGYASAKTFVLIALVLTVALLKRKVETWQK